MMTRHLLILSRYSRMGASSRLRMLQYIPWLEAAGIRVEVASLFDDAYLEALYGGHPIRRGGLLRYYSDRVARLRASPRPDLIWLEKEALPGVPWPIERRLMPRGVPVISDYDDAVFHDYDLHRRAVVRQLLGHKFDGVMAASALVLAGNDYLAARAQQAGAPQLAVVPTVVDTDAYGSCPAGAKDGKPKIGWIGTPRNWTDHCVPMLAMLSEVISAHNATFRAIGAVAPDQPLPGFEFSAWSEAGEIRLIQGLDIGIMPLADTPFARGKCGYKLIQYMACGLPVVASPVGVNRSIVEPGINGFLASSATEWRAALATLLADPDLRRRMGAAGRRKVEREFSIQVHGPKVAAMLRDIPVR